MKPIPRIRIKGISALTVPYFRRHSIGTDTLPNKSLIDIAGHNYEKGYYFRIAVWNTDCRV